MKLKAANYLLILLLPVILLGLTPQSGVSVISNGDVLYLSNTLVIKFKQNSNIVSGGSVILPEEISTKLSRFNVVSAKQMFPSMRESSGLSQIIIIRYTSSHDPYAVAAELKKDSHVLWAEPKFVYSIDYTPNDPSYAAQWALNKISAAQAWDITKGDTTVLIAINDTGVDWDHPDLSANIWTNGDEIPGNGLDDDGNGFIDDIRGWDFGGLNGTPDNNPMEDRPDHGTHVAGIAAATTDNGVGIASIGFNSRIMPVKTSRDDVRNSQGLALISYGYEGIAYAVENGAKVINTSWGGNGFSILGQEIIAYAVTNGTLIVAASGNDNNSSPFYPASYVGVLSVASTNQDDSKSSFSNYGTEIDVSAPGSNIYSTWQNNTYINLGGTSMSSPHAAGLAALVASVFPSYNPIQISEQIRVNSDNIDAINPSFQYLLGKGRINAFKAVTSTNSISVRAVDFEYSDEAPGGNGDGIFMPGETILIGVTFINFLNPTSGLNITLEQRNSYSVIQNGTFNAGALATMEEFNNYSSRFSFTIMDPIPSNAKLDFLIKYSDGDYSDYQWTQTVANPTYGTQSGNEVALTITSKGALAFNNYPDNTQGDGFRYLGESNLLFEGALMLGTSSSQISDAARGANQSVQNNDFQVVQPFVISIPGSTADYQGYAIFNDNNAGSSKIGVTVHLNSYSFVEPPYNNFIMLRYSIINNTASPIANLYAGLFFDWDLIDGSGAGDMTSYESSANYGYVYNTTGGPDYRVATALVSPGSYGFYAIKNDGTDGGIGVYDGFTDSEKWLTLSGGITKPDAGPADISHVVSGGPYNIEPGDTVDAAFIIAAGADNEVLTSTVLQGRTLYQAILTDVNDNISPVPLEFSLQQNYPNPFNPSTVIKYSIPVDAFVSLIIYDINGREVQNLVNKDQTAGNYEVSFKPEAFASGVYFYKITAGKHTSVKKMMLLK